MPALTPEEAELALTYYGDLLKRARELTRDPLLAEDLVQETYLRLAESPPTFRGDLQLYHWLRTVLARLVIDRRRRPEIPTEPQDA